MTNQHPTITKNADHRADLTWTKDSNGYFRADGVMIRKVAGMSSAWWQVLLPNGEQAQLPLGDGSFSPYTPAAGPSLFHAKLAAEDVTAETPAYTPRAR